ncbi:MAG: phospholipase D family protein [Bacteroidales bacterium]|nr:phospholipase D family protein [Bacteroidales bacterium]
MAKFLTTVGNSYYIEQIIINAKKNLTLVTPYLQLSKNLTERIIDADKRGVQITFIYGKSSLSDAEKRKLSSLNNIQIFYFKDLHAKCYHNEDSMIISSMNLYEFSERNNREMGILAERETDGEIFNDAIREIESIINSSIAEKNTSQPIKIETKSNNNAKGEIQTQKGCPHFPRLFEELKKKYPYSIIEKDSEGDVIYIKDFIPNKIEIRIHWYVVECHYLGRVSYKWMEAANRKNIEKVFEDKRVYWNTDRIKIYPPKSHQTDTSIIGIKHEVELAIDVIEKVKDKLLFRP